MNKRTILSISSGCLLLGMTVWAAPLLMSVQVRESALRAKPSYLGRPGETLDYGQQVEVLTTQGAWMEVRAGSDTGWVHESALTKKKIVLKSGSERAGSAASSEEVALAGRGFNAEVEAEFKQGTGLDFSGVDLMEKKRISDKAKLDFLREGGVMPPSGGGS